jgi:hypothetical protein
MQANIADADLDHIEEIDKEVEDKTKQSLHQLRPRRSDKSSNFSK